MFFLLPQKLIAPAQCANFRSTDAFKGNALAREQTEQQFYLC